MTEYNGKRNSLILISFTYFSLGAFALVSQTMLLREFFVVVYGNEFIFGVLLANWLLGIFCGALLGGSRAEKSKQPLLLFMISILVLCALLPVSITLTRLLYLLSGTPPGVYIGFLKVFFFSALLIIPISFCIGFVFPLAAKVQLRELPEIREQREQPHAPGSAAKVKGISDIYIYEAFGSLFGGILYTFVLVGRCNAYWVAGLFMLPLVGCAGIILFRARFIKTLVPASLLAIFTLALLLPPVSHKLDSASVAKRWESVSTLPLAYSIDSKYQNIAVAEVFNQYNVYLNTMLSAVFPNPDDNMLLAAHLVCQHPNPRRFLVIGDAVSGLAKSLLDFGVEEVVSVEIDAQAVAAVLKFLPEEDKRILSDPRFKIVIRDGRQYVKDLVRAYRLASSPASLASTASTAPPAPRFDLVYLNVSEPSTLLLNRYYTKEFFLDLGRVMGETGVLALKVTASENYESGIVTDYTASIFHTVRAVFPEVAVSPGVRSFLFAARADGIVSDDPALLARRFSAAGLKPEKLGMIFYSLYPPELTRFVTQSLLARQTSAVNTDDSPIASLYFNKIIGWYGESNLSGFLGFFEGVGFGHVLAIILGLSVLRLVYVWGMERRTTRVPRRFLKFHTLVAVFVAGLAGLSLELVILYTFQNDFGDIYYLVGFIIAVFMFGLPLGALVSKAWLTRGRLVSSPVSTGQVIGFIICILAGLAGISFFFPAITRWFSGNPFLHQVMLFLETMLIGFAVGLVFPLAVHLYLGEREKSGKTAGIIDAFDHIGAAVGAFVVGTLFLPVMGVSRVCGLVALFPLIAAFLLFIDLRKVPGAGC